MERPRKFGDEVGIDEADKDTQGTVEKFQAFAQGGHIQADAELRERLQQQMQVLPVQYDSPTKSQKSSTKTKAAEKEEETLIDLGTPTPSTPAGDRSPVRRTWEYQWNLGGRKGQNLLD